MLLEREDVDPDPVDTGGRTPLWCAAGRGHSEIVKMLLEREDVNPNQAAQYCQTPLPSAAWSGNLEVVKMLLEREEVNPHHVPCRQLGPNASLVGC